MTDDIKLLTRRLDALSRTADKISRHLIDLHHCAYEPTTRPDVQVRSSQTDYTPRAGDPRAQQLWSSISLRVGQVEAVLVGIERALMGYFYAGSTSPEPSRGSLISAGEHAHLLAKQQRRPDTPTRLVDQPQHPGRR